MVKEVVVSEQYPLQEKSLDDKHSNVIQEDDIEEDDDETNRLSTTSNSRDEVEEIKKIIREETKVVRNWRWVVIVAMLLVGGAVTTLTSIFLTNEEEDDFEDSFKQFATTLLESSTFSASTIRTSCKDFADQITTTVRQSDTDWPFVTIPDFKVHAQNLRRQTISVGFFLLPVVEPQDRMQWVQYVMSNLDWYEGSPFFPDIWSFNSDFQPKAYDWNATGPFLPVWQADPLPVSPLINYDSFSLPDTLLLHNIMETLGQGVVGEVLSQEFVDLLYPSDTVEPDSFYYQPLYDSFDQESKKVVGELLILLRWNVHFSDILPDDVRGIYLVLENTCNDTATWEIEGKEARYVGSGDLHDTAYDSYKLSADFNTYGNVEAARKAGACIYTVNVYPSQEFEDDYKSSSPISLTVVVGAVFLSMVTAFLAYDLFQRKRNTKVVANAAKSNALVSSLFPSNIRDRLLDQPANNNKKKNHHMTSHMGKLQNLLDGGIMDEDAAAGLNTPIADLFLETTIMFADITDFTAWSSMREPTQVFTLLENVFSSLDRLAQKRRVFKVETVGDCYVAVAGLPEKRKDHAVVMARFAMDAF